jgi:hypothetical protein
MAHVRLAAFCDGRLLPMQLNRRFSTALRDVLLMAGVFVGAFVMQTYAHDASGLGDISSAPELPLVIEPSISTGIPALGDFKQAIFWPPSAAQPAGVFL